MACWPFRDPEVYSKSFVCVQLLVFIDRFLFLRRSGEGLPSTNKYDPCYAWSCYEKSARKESMAGFHISVYKIYIYIKIKQMVTFTLTLIQIIIENIPVISWSVCGPLRYYPSDVDSEMRPVTTPIRENCLQHGSFLLAACVKTDVAVEHFQTLTAAGGLTPCRLCHSWWHQNHAASAPCPFVHRLSVFEAVVSTSVAEAEGWCDPAVAA